MLTRAKTWLADPEHQFAAGATLIVVVVLVLLKLVGSAPTPSPLTEELQKAKQEKLVLQSQLDEASRSAEVFRTENLRLESELESARKRTRTVVKEVFKNGQVVERTTDNRTDNQVVKQKETKTRAASESIKYIEVVKWATLSIAADATESVVQKTSYDTRTGFSAGSFVMVDELGLGLSWQALTLDKLSLDVLVGAGGPTEPFAGVGASFEILPRLGVGASYLVNPLDFRRGPALTLMHRF